MGEHTCITSKVQNQGATPTLQIHADHYSLEETGEKKNQIAHIQHGHIAYINSP